MTHVKQTKTLRVGDVAPDFELKSQQGDTIRLSDFRGKKWVVLYFYPKDNTRGCIVESTSFRDSFSEFQQAGAEIIGVSSDDQDSHLSFAQEYSLPFRLLSDPKAGIRKQYGVPKTFGIIPGRVTFLIDKNGIIQFILSSQFNPRSHVDQALAVLKSK